MAEWLCRGLQSLVRRFDSGFGLNIEIVWRRICCPGGGIGRHKGLKIPRRKLRAGSSPAPGTNFWLPTKIVYSERLF